MEAFQIVQPPIVESEPLVSPWLMFYILLILFYNCIVVYSRIRNTKENVLEEFINEYCENKCTVVWSFGTIVFFVIYGMWNL